MTSEARLEKTMQLLPDYLEMFILGDGGEPSCKKFPYSGAERLKSPCMSRGSSQ